MEHDLADRVSTSQVRQSGGDLPPDVPALPQTARAGWRERGRNLPRPGNLHAVRCVDLRWRRPVQPVLCRARSAGLSSGMAGPLHPSVSHAERAAMLGRRSVSEGGVPVVGDDAHARAEVPGHQRVDRRPGSGAPRRACAGRARTIRAVTRTISACSRSIRARAIVGRISWSAATLGSSAAAGRRAAGRMGLKACDACAGGLPSYDPSVAHAACQVRGPDRPMTRASAAPSVDTHVVGGASASPASDPSATRASATRKLVGTSHSRSVRPASHHSHCASVCAAPAGNCTSTTPVSHTRSCASGARSDSQKPVQRERQPRRKAARRPGGSWKP